jgi:hypothetical protein
MNLTCLIPLFVLVATNCHSAIAKEGQARRLDEEWEKSPSKGTNPSKGSKATNPSNCKATSPSKGSKGTNPSKGGKAPKSSKGKASTVTTSCDDDDETNDNTPGYY